MESFGIPDKKPGRWEKWFGSEKVPKFDEQQDETDPKSLAEKIAGSDPENVDAREKELDLLKDEKFGGNQPEKIDDPSEK